MATLEVTCPDGKVLSFDGIEFEKVRFGRDPNWADIVLDESLAAKGVGREHCELVVNPGCYAIEMNNDNIVWVDGRQAFDGKNLNRECSISFVKDDPTTTYKLKTKLVGGVETVRVEGGVKGQYDGAFKKIALSGLGLVGVGAVVFYLQIPDDLSGSELEAISSGVFSIQAEGSGSLAHTGTAWLAGENLLITNRHVADYIKQSQNMRDDVFIRLPSVDNKVGEKRAIARVVKHPGEKLFANYRNAHKARLENPSMLRLDVYDVALVEVSGAPLAITPLKIATDTEIQSLKGGDRLAIVGFPLTPAGKEPWNKTMPVPEVRFGNFDRSRSYFGSVGSSETNPLMSYAIKTAGGNSGSPILNMAGKVIALHFAGTKILVKGVQKDVLVGGDNSYGQNARLVRQLIDGSIAYENGQFSEADTIKLETPYWQKWLQSMPTIEETTVSELDEKLMAENKCVLAIREPWSAAEDVSPRVRRFYNKEIPLTTSGHYAVFLQSFDPSGFRLDVSTGNLGKSLGAGLGETHFEFEFKNSAGNSNFNLTMGGPNGEGDYGIMVYTWGREACDSNGYRKR